MLIDRASELERLAGLLGRGEPALVLMYGRRRVGKTYLLSRAFPATPSFYFTASETTAAQNRRALISAFSEWSGEAVEQDDYPTWRSVFRLLLDFSPTNPLVITLDEFQYFGEDQRALNTVASELNAVWERRRERRTLLLILAGSSTRILEALNEGGSPLYGRFAWQSRLRPFDYWHAGEMSGFETLRDRATTYGIFGGIPRYLAAIDADRSLGENVTDLMLLPTGEVRELVQTALYQEQGLRSIPKYVAILRAIGRGRAEQNEIAQAAGLDNGPPLRDKLNRLMDLDYIESSRNLGAGSKEPYRYRLSDPALRFFYEFVAPLESALATQDPTAIWKKYIRDRLNAYMGLIFESIAEQAYYRLTESRDLPLVKEWGRWEGLDRNRQPVEIDIACDLLDKRVLSGAIKWNKTPIDPQVHVDHLRALDRLADSGVKWAHLARNQDSPLLYVAAGGFKEGFRQVAEASRQEVHLWTLEDLY